MNAIVHFPIQILLIFCGCNACHLNHGITTFVMNKVTNLAVARNVNQNHFVWLHKQV